jgi:hypothetical protein
MRAALRGPIFERYRPLLRPFPAWQYEEINFATGASRLFLALTYD